ncbi:MAG: phytase [Rhodothalassiaceae bacterium]
MWWLLAAQLVLPSAETAPVASLEDAADDAAIWVHPEDPARSLILGTDKQAGLRVYDLSGREIAFLPIGRLNNVDVARGIGLAGLTGDLAAASNRSDDSVTLFAVSEAGVEQVSAFSVGPEPYGLCLGQDRGRTVIFVAYKQGYVQPYVLTGLDRDPIALRPAFFAGQTEGCAYDAPTKRLYVAEEQGALWAVPLFEAGLAPAGWQSIAEVGGPEGLVGDAEGVTIYRTAEDAVLLVSSQGDDSVLAFDIADGHAFLGKFRIVADAQAGVDGAQETDGIVVTATGLGPAYPKGLLVVQDGFNVDGVDADGRTEDEVPLAPQNFKLIDWRDVMAALRPGK